MQMGRSGMGVGGNFGQMLADNGEMVQDYNNEKVQVSFFSILFIFFGTLVNPYATGRI